MTKKCSQIRCPFQRIESDNCNFDDCPYRTEAIDPQEVISGIGNYIADLVVQKLKAEKEEAEKLGYRVVHMDTDSTKVYCPHSCGYCKHSRVPRYIEPCRSCSIKDLDMTNVIDNFEPKEE